MSEHIHVRVESQIQYITFARPEKKNAITLEMYEALTRALEDATLDDGVRVTILQGAGRDFTAGNDIAEFVQIAQTPEKMAPIMRFLQGVSTYSKPLLAAVEGRAVGVGATVLLHCDMVFADRGATLQFPFVKLGVVPEAASSFLLPNVAGHQQAFEKLVLGDAFDAEDAKLIGMVNHLCETGEALKLAKAYAEKITQLPPEAVLLSKQLLKSRFQNEVQMALMQEGKLFTDRLRSKEAHAAFSAFLNRPKSN